MKDTSPVQHYMSEPLWDRHQAADYLKLQPGTLAVWDCTKRYDLKPIKIGRSVRYSPTYLREFAHKYFFMPE